MAMLLMLSSSACSDFLEEEPKDLLTPSLFPASENDVVQLMGGVLTRMGRGVYYDRGLWDVIAAGSDHVTGRFEPGNPRGDLEHYTFLTDNQFILDVWQTNYFNINAMNQILAAIEGKEDNWVPGYRGAALTLRAFSYFNLVRLYGDIPVITEPITDLQSGIDIARSPVAEVYSQIEQDLLEAEDLLDGVDLGRDGLPTVGFAKTLLATVYLTMAGFPLQDESKWALAAAKAAEVKASGTYSLVRPYSDLWLLENENGPEHIFSIQYTLGGSNDTRSLITARTRPRVVGSLPGFGQFYGDLDLFNKFSSDDERLFVSMDTTLVSTETNDPTSPPRTYSFREWGRIERERVPRINKYFDSGRPPEQWFEFSRRTATNQVVFRYAEALLILAEAENEANSGPTPAAYEAINEVRDRAGLAPLSGLSESDFRDAVRLERELELCFELKRRYDLVRYGTFFDVMSQDEFAVDGIQPHNVLYPIPENEISINPNLTQNDGY